MRGVLKSLFFVILLFTLYHTPTYAIILEHEGSNTGGHSPSSGSSNSGGTTVVTEDAISVNTETYTFTDRDTLTNSAGTSNPDLFPAILKAKQQSVIQEFSQKAEGKFSSKTITGDLVKSTGGTLWGEKLSDLKNNNSPTTITMRQGSTQYNIKIPEGRNGTVNQAHINNAIAAIEKYQEAVKEAVLAGSIRNSYNIYSLYPARPVPLLDVMENELNENGNRSGRKSFKMRGSAVAMNYSLVGFINPLFGRLAPEDINSEGNPQKYFESRIKDVELKPSGTDGTLNFSVDTDFTSFLSSQSSDGATLAPIDNNAVVRTDGVRSYRTKISGGEVKPESLVDASMQLIVPAIFSQSNTSSAYNLNNVNGYELIDGLKLLVTHNFVIQQEGEATTNLGDYNTFGIDDRSLVLTSTTLNEEGKFDPNGTRTGAILPLWYKEVVVNVGGGAEAQENDYFYTGRTIKLANDFSGKVTLDASNRNLVGVDSKAYGLQGIQLRRFAFAENTDHESGDDHYSLETNPSTFRVHVAFANVSDKDLYGFLLFRNNWYSNDPDLIRWLETDEAKAMTDVEAERLHEIITGNFTVDKTPLSYEEWVRLQEIRAELDSSLKTKLISLTRVLAIIFGVALIFYSILLMIAYWLDILNPLTEKSILNLMTAKKLYPINSKQDMIYQTYTGEGVIYATFWRVFFIMLAGIGIGILFMYLTPIITFLVYVYHKVIELVGVV